MRKSISALVMLPLSANFLRPSALIASATCITPTWSDLRPPIFVRPLRRSGRRYRKTKRSQVCPTKAQVQGLRSRHFPAMVNAIPPC